jgi:hypothetical protein
MMGYMAHNAIVVTSWNEDLIQEAAREATSLGLQILGPSEEVVNGYRSILICPDGSKEGWDDSNDGDSRRESFRAWLNSKRYEDGSTPLDWVEIRYGPDDNEAEIVASNTIGTTDAIQSDPPKFTVRAFLCECPNRKGTFCQDVACYQRCKLESKHESTKA